MPTRRLMTHEERGVGVALEAEGVLTARLVGALAGEGVVGVVAGGEVRVGGRVPQVGVDAVQDPVQVGVAGLQQAVQAVAVGVGVWIWRA
jgi:hypothetical protein